LAAGELGRGLHHNPVVRASQMSAMSELAYCLESHVPRQDLQTLIGSRGFKQVMGDNWKAASVTDGRTIRHLATMDAAAIVNQNTRQMVIIVRGTAQLRDVDAYLGGDRLAGNVATVVYDAQREARRLGYELVVTGHSYGGYQAHEYGIAMNCQSFAFQPPRLREGDMAAQEKHWGRVRGRTVHQVGMANTEFWRDYQANKTDPRVLDKQFTIRTMDDPVSR
jgi:hypothetical protein